MKSNNEHCTIAQKPLSHGSEYLQLYHVHVCYLPREWTSVVLEFTRYCELLTLTRCSVEDVSDGRKPMRLVAISCRRLRIILPHSHGPTSFAPRRRQLQLIKMTNLTDNTPLLIFSVCAALVVDDWLQREINAHNVLVYRRRLAAWHVWHYNRRRRHGSCGSRHRTDAVK